MLALAMAFLSEPKLLMIDELSLGLAPVVVEQLLGVVRSLRDCGTTIILVEQSVNVALTVADTAYFMEKGEIRFHGPTAELLDRPGRAPLGVPPGRRRSCLGEGETASLPARPAAAADGDPAEARAHHALDVSGVSVSFGGIRAVSDVSFQVAPGEVVGLIGPNGAGKTTVFDLVWASCHRDRRSRSAAWTRRPGRAADGPHRPRSQLPDSLSVPCRSRSRRCSRGARALGST
ncbi:MAG: ATP-binding cassette domain-containing protein [Acidimicrobiales bacterium]